MSSLAETPFDYGAVVWTCALLPYRIIACRDAIQYIVQVRNEKAYRNLSYFSEWEPIERHYPQLAMAGLPQNSPEVLSHEVRRRVVLNVSERTNTSPRNDELEASFIT